MTRLNLKERYDWVRELKEGTFRDAHDAHLNQAEVIELYDEIVRAQNSEDVLLKELIRAKLSQRAD